MSHHLRDISKYVGVAAAVATLALMACDRPCRSGRNCEVGEVCRCGFGFALDDDHCAKGGHPVGQCVPAERVMGNLIMKYGLMNPNAESEARQDLASLASVQQSGREEVSPLDSLIDALRLVTGIIGLLTISSLWKMFQKAGHPPWKSFVPIYGQLLVLKIAKRPFSVLWILVAGDILGGLLARDLGIDPAVGLILWGHCFALYVFSDLARQFGKPGWFGLLLLLGVGFPILAFGRASYRSNRHPGCQPSNAD